MNKDKLIKNEQIIRDRNKIASQAIKKYLGPKKDIVDKPIDFICECSDIHCTEPIKVTIAEYEKLHKRNNRFLIVKGHKTPEIEKTIEDKGEFALVEKDALSP